MKFRAYLSSALESSQLKAASSPRSVASSYFIGRPAPLKRNERSRSDSMMQKAARLARHTKDRPFVVDPFFSPYPFPPTFPPSLRPSLPPSFPEMDFFCILIVGRRFTPLLARPRCKPATCVPPPPPPGSTTRRRQAVACIDQLRPSTLDLRCPCLFLPLSVSSPRMRRSTARDRPSSLPWESMRGRCSKVEIAKEIRIEI